MTDENTTDVDVPADVDTTDPAQVRMDDLAAQRAEAALSAVEQLEAYELAVELVTVALADEQDNPQADPDQDAAVDDDQAAPAADEPAAASPPPAPGLTPGVLTMYAADLRDLLQALVVCTSTTSDYPTLTAIRLTTEAGHLVGVATDQYVLGRAHKPATGTIPEPALLSAVGARRMIAELGEVEPGELVSLSTTRQRTGMQTSRGFTGEKWPTLFGEYPAQIVTLLDPAGYEQMGLDGMVAFSPRQLARVHAATEHAGEHIARLYFRGPTDPLRVEVGTWLVMLVMPIKAGPRHQIPTSPAIPFAIPAAPADLPCTAAERTEIGWPRTAAEATPARLARHYAADVSHLHRRMFDEPFPSGLPKWDDQSPVERRISSAYRDVSDLLVHSYAVSLMIRRFAEAAPEAAAAACVELYGDLDYGDSLGEIVWEWLKGDDVDPDALTIDPAVRDAQARAVLDIAYATPPPRRDPFLVAHEAEQAKNAAEPPAGEPTVEQDQEVPAPADA